MGNVCSGDRGPKYEGAPDALVKLCDNPTAPNKAEVEALIKLGIDLRHQVGKGALGELAWPAGRTLRGRGRGGTGRPGGEVGSSCSNSFYPHPSYNAKDLQQHAVLHRY